MADRTHGGNHAPLLNGGWLKPGFCAGCDAERAGEALGAIVHVTHIAADSEEHARIFNEGYEAAMAQHLADDPSAADDWLAAHTAAAKREGARAVVEAATEVTFAVGDWPTPSHCRRVADALDAITPAHYGDILRAYADAEDARFDAHGPIAAARAAAEQTGGA